MKRLFILPIFLIASQTWAASFPLKNPLPKFPDNQERELYRIWELCIDRAEVINFPNSGYAYLENKNPECSRLGLEHIPFKAQSEGFLLDLPNDMNPFSKLKNQKIKLFAFMRSNLDNLRLSPRSQFVPRLTTDVRLNASRNGVPTDIFISQRESVEGWNKIAQVKVSTETRTELCRPRIYCTYTYETHKQTWKDSTTGQIIEKLVTESI